MNEEKNEWEKYQLVNRWDKTYEKEQSRKNEWERTN